MENLVHTIRQLQSGGLTRPEFFAQLDRVLAAAHDSPARLLEALSEEHARAPLQAEVYTEVQRRIEQLIVSRERMGSDDTLVQTRPGNYQGNPGSHQGSYQGNYQDSNPGNYQRNNPRTSPSNNARNDPRNDPNISHRATTAPWPAAMPAGARDEPFGPEPERMKAVGDTLNGRFVLEECIGFGGMGTVYKALDLRKQEASDRNPYIAIKVLNVQFRGHPKSLIALQREARKAQSLAHENIVAVYDFDRDGAMVYLTMEYLSGKPLSQVLKAPGFSGMRYPDALRIVTGMANALAYAHQRGFVHCDFKPGNVFLTDAGVVKVIDFGIARVFQKAEEAVDVTVFDPGSLGALTPAYASPEMLEHRDPDPRDDIYALGCITYELLTGHHPFNRLSAVQARDAGMRPQRPPNLGRRQWQALRCALAFEREARTPTVARFLGQLGQAGGNTRFAMLAGSAAAIAAAAALAVWGVRALWPQPADTSQRAGEAAAPAEVAPTAAAPTAVTPTAAPGAAAPAPVATPAPVPAPPAPAPTADALAITLAAIPCSALVATVQGHAVAVSGYLPKSFGPARLRDRLAAMPGVASVGVDVQQLDADKCAVIDAFGPYWVAHRRAGGGARIRLAEPHASPGAVLTEGDPLVVDVTTSAAPESFISVDYHSLDGNVVHLLPNPRARDNRAPANYTASIGSMGEWAVGKPFGSELIVLLTTPVPLFDTLRPVTEPSADYLAAVTQRLRQVSARNGADKIAVDFVQISTRARKR
ncbi:MAG: protein kinase [Massilia sp.]|nr:protein kinase [Massilia sp.]